MKKEIFRQGDVLLIETNETLKEDAKLLPRDHSRIVLAYGEVTGHAHAISDADAYLCALNDDRYLKIGVHPVDLVHEEHAKIPLKPKKLYRIIRQREFSDGYIQTVLD